MKTMEGVYVPVVTPFDNGRVDTESFISLIKKALKSNVSGIVVCGTTGESLSLSVSEKKSLAIASVEVARKKTPIFMGLCESSTDKALREMEWINKLDINGVLVSSPPYLRPSQQGLYTHFEKLSDATDKNIVVYNIPYRTGVDIENETLISLSEIFNIVAVKDCSADFNKTLDLINNFKQHEFSVLTGEDHKYLDMLLVGADGGIVASANTVPLELCEIFEFNKKGNTRMAQKTWAYVSQLISIYFSEPNPGPIKYHLHKTGEIKSPECRLPLMPVTEEAINKLDDHIFPKTVSDLRRELQ